MDMEPVTLKLLYAGIGLLVGGGLVIVIRSRTGRTHIRRIVLFALPVLGGGAGLMLSSHMDLPALLVQKVPNSAAQAEKYSDAGSAPPTPAKSDVPRQNISSKELRALIDKAIAALDDPFFVAVLEREPRRATISHERFEAAYRRGGEEALGLVIEETVRQVAEQAMPHYLARAQEKDLLSASGLLQNMMQDLTTSDPETCYLWLYGASTERSFDYDKFVSAVGRPRHQLFTESLATTVRNANDFLPEYDTAYAVERMGKIGEKIYTLLGDERIGIIQAGQQPSSLEEMKLACEASSTIYRDVLKDERPVVLLQHMFSGADTFAASY